MWKSKDEAEQNLNDVAKGKLGEKIKTNADGYKKGAIVGAVIGVLAALYFKRSILGFGLIGLVGGGYVGYQLNESKKNKETFENPKLNKDANSNTGQ